MNNERLFDYGYAGKEKKEKGVRTLFQIDRDRIRHSSERDRELMYMLGDRERKKVREIDNALLKIKEGTYGVCDECGEPISKKRLKIIPYSNLCINCQSRAEEEEKKRMSEDYIDHLSTLSLISDDETFKDSDE